MVKKIAIGADRPLYTTSKFIFYNLQLAIMSEAKFSDGDLAEEHALHALGVGVGVAVAVERIVCKIDSLSVDDGVLTTKRSIKTLRSDLRNDIRCPVSERESKNQASVSLHLEKLGVTLTFRETSTFAHMPWRRLRPFPLQSLGSPAAAALPRNFARGSVTLLAARSQCS